MSNDFGDGFFDAALGIAQQPISSFLAGQGESPSAFPQYNNNAEVPQGGSAAYAQPEQQTGLNGFSDLFSMLNQNPVGQDWAGIQQGENAQAQSSTFQWSGYGAKPPATPAAPAAPNSMVRPASIGGMAVEPNRNSPYYAMAVQAANAAGVDADIFSRQMSWESGGFDPNVVSGARKSSAGALGVAQFMPATAAGLGVNPLDPEAALFAAARMMSELVRKNGDYRLALLEYNGGPGAVIAAKEGAMWEESATYLTKILGTSSMAANTAPAPTNVGGAGAGQVLGNGYAFPVTGYSGVISPHWGVGDQTGGTDIMAPAGTVVVSMRSGTVMDTGSSGPGGNWALIQGDDGLTYYYAHFQAPSNVTRGQSVQAGQQIGQVGNTGNASGGPSHLHIGIGFGIRDGVGPTGGLGQDYDAVSLLRSLLGGR